MSGKRQWALARHVWNGFFFRACQGWNSSLPFLWWCGWWWSSVLGLPVLPAGRSLGNLWVLQFGFPGTRLSGLGAFCGMDGNPPCLSVVVLCCWLYVVCGCHCWVVIFSERIIDVGEADFSRNIFRQFSSVKCVLIFPIKVPLCFGTNGETFEVGSWFLHILKTNQGNRQCFRGFLQ